MWLHFLVQDTGIGMSPAFLPHAFEAYSQENTQRRPIHGAGLGLTIAKQLAEKMGGSISIESTQGKGTSVEMDLPIEPTTPEQMPQPKAPLDDKRLRGKRVLLAEDDQLNMEVAAYLLRLKGVEVDCIYDGQEAVRRYFQQPAGTYTAIILDLYMPIMDGIQAAKAIRQEERKTGGHVPILAITADAFEEERQQTRQAGMDAHLTKPIDPKALYAAILKWI